MPDRDSPDLGAKLQIELRTYQPDDFETLYQIDQVCYAQDTAYSRSDLRAYLGFLGSECVVAEIKSSGGGGKLRNEMQNRTGGKWGKGGSGSEVQVVRRRGAKVQGHRDAKLVAQTNDAIAGFCISAHRDREGYIITMDVLEKYRRSGIGSLLLQEVERRLAETGVRRVGLETATDNEPAVAFWQKHGYRTRGVRKGYYPHGGDAYSMTKQIADSHPGKT